MTLRYRPDEIDDFNSLLFHPDTDNGMPQVLPRTTICGSREAVGMGLIPMLDYPDHLVQPADFKEVIERCREQRIFPVFHQEASGVFKDGWDQDGFGFCWAYGATAAVMMIRALEGKSPVRLAPFSLGWLTNWRNAGYYPDRTIAGIKERGIASAEYVPEYSLNHRKFKDGWENDALNYRIEECWDTRWLSEVSMIQQCLTVLSTGVPGSVAYNWWNHALACVGMKWDERARNNVVWELLNSHDDGVIELEGRRGVPDEFYGVRAASLKAA